MNDERPEPPETQAGVSFGRVARFAASAAAIGLLAVVVRPYTKLGDAHLGRTLAQLLRDDGRARHHRRFGDDPPGRRGLRGGRRFHHAPAKPPTPRRVAT